MLLELDAGNSRIKWRLSELQGQGAAARVGAVLKRGVVPAADTQASIAELLQQLAAAKVQRILVGSVRTADFRQALTHRFKEQFAVVPEFAVAQADNGALRSAYAQSEKLGVDRWLALVAAYNLEQGACCVLDCGTTITLDVVAASGQHLGGYIVPGLRLLRDSLIQRSAALNVPEVTDLAATTAPGNNTAAAIANGVLNMALGFIRDQQQQLASAAATPRWYCTGGDAELLTSYVEWPCILVPDLVLDGLRQVLLQGSSSKS